jgi:hypothetical protein
MDEDVRCYLLFRMACSDGVNLLLRSVATPERSAAAHPDQAGYRYVSFRPLESLNERFNSLESWFMLSD